MRTGGAVTVAAVVAVVALMVAIALLIASGLPVDDGVEEGIVEAEVHVVTGADTGASTDAYGLLPTWEDAYSGTSVTHTYDFDGDGNEDIEQCGNCHMEAEYLNGGSKFLPPFHPLAVQGLTGDGFSGEWFLDDGQHRGPNTQLVPQPSGILPTVNCGECHTAQNASGVATSNADATDDPHSVHRDVMSREGCIRCHSFDNMTFDRTGNGFGGVAFTQGNATRTTYGVANPINMTRVWDGVLLSTANESVYSYDAGGTGLQPGAGWNRYGTADSSVNQYSCGDCHGLFHAEQGYAETGGNGLEFAFNDSPSSRKGPLAQVKDNESYGLQLDDINVTCGSCHPLDAHAVHTNGRINSVASYAAVNDATDQSIINSGVLGAELCDECHTTRILGTERHFQRSRARGFAGTATDSHNRLPDLNSEQVGSADNDNEDCGFCHLIYAP